MMKTKKGFIAALDQSGGSSAKTLKLYGIDESSYNGDEEMFNLIHEMRTRIMTSKSFTSEKIVGVILFEQTMNRKIEGKYTSEYLWDKGILSFLKSSRIFLNSSLNSANPFLSSASVVFSAASAAVCSIRDGKLPRINSIARTHLVVSANATVTVHSPFFRQARPSLCHSRTKPWSVRISSAELLIVNGDRYSGCSVPLYAWKFTSM